MASESGPVPNLNRELRRMHESGQAALIAIAVYKKTLAMSIGNSRTSGDRMRVMPPTSSLCKNYAMRHPLRLDGC